MELLESTVYKERGRKVIIIYKLDILVHVHVNY